MRRSVLEEDLNVIADMVFEGGRQTLAAMNLNLPERIKAIVVEIFADRLECRLEWSVTDVRKRLENIERIRTALNLLRTFGRIDFDEEAEKESSM